MSKSNNLAGKLSNEGSKKLLDRVNDNYIIIEEIVDEVIKPYCSELDNLMDDWRRIITDSANPPLDDELHEAVIELPTILYFASEGVEKLGIKEDIAIAIRNELYNKTHLVAEGTVAVKESQAELASQEEFIVQSAYKRAYKIMKLKLEAGYELLNSTKKVIGARCTLMELTKIDAGRSKNR